MYSSNLVMSEEIEDEFYKDGDVTELRGVQYQCQHQPGKLYNQNRDGQNKEDVNMNSANNWSGQEYKGPGRTLTVFTEDEEMKIAKYIRG